MGHGPQVAVTAPLVARQTARPPVEMLSILELVHKAGIHCVCHTSKAPDFTGFQWS